MDRTTRSGLRPAWAVALSLAVVLTAARLCAAQALLVRAMFRGSPIPGATVTASRGATQRVTTTDEDGEGRLTLDEGAWIVRVDMRGFRSLTREVTVGPEVAPISVELTLVSPDSALQDTAGDAGAPGGERPVSPSAEHEGPPAAAEPGAAADGLVVNGSAYNAAASPFAQPPAFGNNRPGSRSLFNGSLGLIGGNSAWDARPFSFSGQRAPAPDYTDMQFAGTFAGPLKIPFLRGTRPLLNLSYQRSATTTANTVRSRVPTALERAGDFSESRDGRGAPVAVVDPSTGAPFPQATIPVDRLSPQALALLSFYPAPDVDGDTGSNYETTVSDRTVRDALQARVNTSITTRQQLTASVSYQRTSTTSTSLFAFTDRSRATDVDASASWSYRLSPTKSMRARYELLGTSMTVQPFFAGRVDVSGDGRHCRH